MAGVTVPGSENEAAIWTTRQATTTAMPKYLHTADIDELTELKKERLESGHKNALIAGIRGVPACCLAVDMVCRDVVTGLNEQRADTGVQEEATAGVLRGRDT